MLTVALETKQKKCMTDLRKDGLLLLLVAHCYMKNEFRIIPIGMRETGIHKSKKKQCYAKLSNLH